MSTNILQIGQKLVIPSMNEPTSLGGQTYTVQKGDTLYAIAGKYGISVNNLMQANNLSSTNLSIGQKLIIPGNNIVYTVKSGDTLYAIARRYNTTVDAIKRLNNLSTNTLQINQQLKIPR